LGKESEVLQERLKLLDEYTSDLRAFQEISFQEYQENKIIRRAVERTLHLVVETCLDIGRHMIVLEGFRAPEDNKDVFRVLNEEGIVSETLLASLISMAGFRNLIVHDYTRIDDGAVFGILRKRLGDFDQFAKAVIQYIDS
jgi:uncharacterized protein YutE (UPF0331/DUF86 family)